MSGTGQFWLHWQETESGKRERNLHPLAEKEALSTLRDSNARARGDIDHWLTELTPAALAKYQARKTAGHL